MVKSKAYNLDGTLGATRYIKNPGPIANVTSSTIKKLGVISLASFAIGAADNFINYENECERTGVDFVAAAVSFVAGVAIGTLAIPASAGVLGTLIVGVGISQAGSIINKKYNNKPKGGN